jgi:hypothetical protein
MTTTVDYRAAALQGESGLDKGGRNTRVARVIPTAKVRQSPVCLKRSHRLAVSHGWIFWAYSDLGNICLSS